MAARVWSEKDLVRRASRCLAVLRHTEEISGNVAATCRLLATQWLGSMPLPLHERVISAARKCALQKKPHRAIVNW